MFTSLLFKSLKRPIASSLFSKSLPFKPSSDVAVINKSVANFLSSKPVNVATNSAIFAGSFLVSAKSSDFCATSSFSGPKRFIKSVSVFGSKTPPATKAFNLTSKT